MCPKSNAQRPCPGKPRWTWNGIKTLKGGHIVRCFAFLIVLGLLPGVVFDPTTSPSLAAETSGKESGAINAAAQNNKDCEDPDQISISGDWMVVKGPLNEGGPLESDNQRVPEARYALGGKSSPRLYVTEGRAVFRSDDDGCTWTEIYASPDWPARIVDLAVAAGDEDFVYVVEVTETSIPFASGLYGLVSETRIVVSRDGGLTWDVSWTSTEGGSFESAGRTPFRIDVSPSDPEVAYLSFGIFNRRELDTLYASEDGGQTWELRNWPATSSDLDADTPQAWYRLAIDPVEPNELWVMGRPWTTSVEGVPPNRNALFASKDGGRTWSQKEVDEQARFGVGTNASGLDLHIHRVPGRQARLAVLGHMGVGGPPVMFWSPDGGDTWSTIPVSSLCSSSPCIGSVLNIAGGRKATDLFVFGDGDVLRFEPRTGDFLSLGASSLRAEHGNWRDLRTDAANRPYFITQRREGGAYAIVRYARSARRRSR